MVKLRRVAGSGILLLGFDTSYRGQVLAWWPSSPVKVSMTQRPLRQQQEDGTRVLVSRPLMRDGFLRNSQLFNGNFNGFDEGNGDSVDTQQQQLKKFPSEAFASSYHTALCIVPPDERWDTLQRARHFAQDKTYRQWPPAIRLFHPFCSREKLTDVALDVAKVIEKHKIKPFSITLNRWTVMPLPDTMKASMDAKGGPGEDKNYDDPDSTVHDEEYLRIQALIASEEKKGKVRQKYREIRRKKRLGMELSREDQDLQLEIESMEDSYFENMLPDTNATPNIPESTEKTESVNEFNGPSIIALEPDERSSRRLKQLRELLRRELIEAHDPRLSPSALWGAPIPIRDEHEEEEYEQYADADDFASFRPLIAIASYPSVDAAINVARKLKGLWDPLTFDVRELHCISQAIDRPKHDEPGQQLYDPSIFTDVHPKSSPSPASKSKNSAPFGCDAAIMLIGEEIEMDDLVNEELANYVMREGEAGGYGRNVDDLKLIEDWCNEEPFLDDRGDDKERVRTNNYELKLDEKGGDWLEIEEWLDGDDDEDEFEDGTAIVFGRTHLFTGEKRTYLNMPASSIDESESSFPLQAFRPGIGSNLGTAWTKNTDFGLQKGREKKQKGSARTKQSGPVKREDW